MTVRILFVGARLCRNLGGPSLLVTTRRVIDEYQKAQYTLLSPTPEDLPFAETYDITIVPTISRIKLLLAALAKAWLGLSFGSPQVRQVIDAFAEADMVVDIWGIMFADSLRRNSPISRALEGLHLLVGKIFRKPVVKYTADLGPFEARWNRFFANFYLEHATDLILARSDATKRRVEELGVTTPIHVCPDTAFLLEGTLTPFAQNLQEQKAEGPIVGFSVSHMAVRQSTDAEGYLDSMAGLADHVIESHGAKIILIPNELSDVVAYDDEHFAEIVRDRMARKTRAEVVSGEYTAQQLKGIIGCCDVVVAARYHSLVASLSQGIPVLAIGWHAKYAAILSLVGQGQSLCSVESLNLEELKARFDALWQARERTGEEIRLALPAIRERILSCGEGVCQLLAKT